MAAPQVTEIVQKHPLKVLIHFDQPLDDEILFPPTCFSINYGKIPINAVGFYGTASILITLERELTSRDKIEVNYQPPEDISVAIRAPVAEGSSNLILRRNAVRAFFKVPVKNMLIHDENSWMANSNLGGGKTYVPDPDDPNGAPPAIDICGDGSIIVPPGNNPDNQPPQTAPMESNIGDAGNSGSVAQLRNLPYPDFNRPTPRVATPDDFILAYGLKEAIQLSNIDDADAIQPNDQKIWMAIEDAAALIDNYITQASRAGKVLISSSRRRTSLIIARYYLDTVRRREDIKQDYERAITELDKARTLADIDRPQLPWWADPCGNNVGVRSHRIPQYYNGVNGKGLDGFWVDSAAEEGTDFRTAGINSQNNNNLSSGGTGIPGVPTQPTEDGGTDQGGSQQP